MFGGKRLIYTAKFTIKEMLISGLILFIRKGLIYITKLIIKKTLRVCKEFELFGNHKKCFMISNFQAYYTFFILPLREQRKFCTCF